MLSSPPRVRSIRLFLLVLLLAFLPLLGWAGGLAHELAIPAEQTLQVTDATASGASADTSLDRTAPADSSGPADPQQSGADLAEQLDLGEQLLPAPPLRVAVPPGRTGPPQYASAALPDPDLPLLPRPPRG